MDKERTRVFDLHCDTLDRLALDDCPEYPAFAEQNRRAGIPAERVKSLKDNDAHLSLDRMKDFDWCQCFAIFIPDDFKGDSAWTFYQRVRDFFFEQCRSYPSALTAIQNPASIESVLSARACAALLTIEGAAFFTDTLSPVERLVEDGVKMVTLTWNGQNAIASGHETHAGFSAFGKQVVRAFEDNHIVVDVSHLNDEGFAELRRFARRPFAASHSNSRSVCDHPRNLTDDQFRAIRDAGGVVGLNLCDIFLTDQKRDPTRDDVLRHVDHWLGLEGEDIVALGSDYDGADVPTWLDRGDRMEDLKTLIVKEFGSSIGEKLFFDNAHRFFLNSTAR